MLAQGPACALARFSFVKSTRAKAQNNIKRSGPFLCRDLAHFYSAIDTQHRPRHQGIPKIPQASQRADLASQSRTDLADRQGDHDRGRDT